MAWTNTDVDALITDGPALLHGLILLCSAAGGDVTLYEGQDPGSGRKVGTFKGEADVSKAIQFRPSLICTRGIYVDVGSSVTEATVLWSPLPGE